MIWYQSVIVPSSWRGVRWASELSIRALRARSRFLLAISGRPYLSAMTSPCSVNLTSPSSTPLGWLRIDAWVGPPPLPMVPPLPWNTLMSTPVSSETSLIWRRALWISHCEVVMPPSLLESE